MIVPMTKYTFLIHHDEQERFLDTIGKLGVIDVTINSYEPSEAEKKVLQYAEQLKTTHEILKNSSFPKDIEEVENKIKDIGKFVECTTLTKERLDAVNSEIIKTEKELIDTEPWGNFSKDDIAQLKQQGIALKFFICGEKQYQQTWNEEYPIHIVNKQRGSIYFVLVTQKAAPFTNLPNFGLEVREPSMSFFDLKTKYDNLLAEKRSLLTTMRSLTADINLVEDERVVTEKELHYLRVSQGNTSVAEGTVIIIESWAPTDKCEAIDKYLESDHTTISFKDEPTLEDNPPVLLKNNKFAQTNELITKLRSLPNYHETDITAYFAPFFVFFVGMCVNDIGYGLIILIISIIARFKFKSESMRPVIGLVFWCSLASVLVGIITGAFFGVSLAELPAFAPIKDIFIKQDSIFYFALAIGVIQILYAIILRAIFTMKRMGFKYGLSYLGWAATIITLILAFLLPKYGVDGFTTDSMLFKIILIAEVAITILFTNPDKGIFSNIGLGLYGLYNNVTGLLGDVLSYIRLFALGLSGGVIAGIFNQLAIGMSPDIPVVKYIIIVAILLIGHGINLFMVIIGSFVHPLRLTFVEFYKNVGFEGGGRAYMPFSGKAKNK